MSHVFVITGPSGVGKGTLIRLLRERVPELALSVSATTRAPRPGEEDGVDYHFLSDEEFAAKVAAGEFVEWAQYSGRRYGTLRAELQRHLDAGHPVVLEIEVQGARQVRNAMPEYELAAAGGFHYRGVHDRLAAAVARLVEIVTTAVHSKA